MQSLLYKLALVSGLVNTTNRKEDAIKVLQKWTLIAVCMFTLACILSSSFPNGNIHLGLAASEDGDLGMRACVVVNLPLCESATHCIGGGEGGNERARAGGWMLGIVAKFHQTNGQKWD